MGQTPFSDSFYGRFNVNDVENLHLLHPRRSHRFAAADANRAARRTLRIDAQHDLQFLSSGPEIAARWIEQFTISSFAVFAVEIHSMCRGLRINRDSLSSD